MSLNMRKVFALLGLCFSELHSLGLRPQNRTLLSTYYLTLKLFICEEDITRPRDELKSSHVLRIKL